MLIQGIKLTGKPMAVIITSIRNSFEHYHSIRGFTKAPQYAYARYVLVVVAIASRCIPHTACRHRYPEQQCVD